jgi:hypothetical protein
MADDWKNKTLKEMWKAYNHQYDNWSIIPPIDVERCEGDIVFKIYCYGNMYKYYTKVFEDEDNDDDDDGLESQFWDEAGDVFGYKITEGHPMKEAFELFKQKKIEEKIRAETQD